MSIGGEIWQIGGEKWGSRRGQSGMGPATCKIQALVSWAAQSMGYHWVLNFKLASYGAHTLGTFQKYPFLRPPSTTSGSLEWIAAPLAWFTPRPALERLCLWLLDMYNRPPFYPICLKRVAIDWAWAEDSDDMFRIPWEWPRKKLPKNYSLLLTLKSPPLNSNLSKNRSCRLIFCCEPNSSLCGIVTLSSSTILMAIFCEQTSDADM
jgi:hypothetical protein